MNSDTTKPSRRQPVALIVGLGILAISLYLIFGNRFMKPKGDTGGTNGSPAASSIETRFRDDGVLTFRKMDGTASQIRIEIARTEQARTQGLMGRKVMRRDQGMLFIFPDAEERSFWMVNTPLPLDIIFVDADRKIVKIHRETVPFSDASLPSGKPAQYTVEVVGGYCAEQGIQEGDAVEWIE